MIFFLYGADTFRSRQKLKELKEKFVRDVDPLGTNIVTLEGGVATLDDFRNASSALSMFTKRRFVAVERLLAEGKKDVQEGIAAMLSNVNFPADHIVVFWEEEMKERRDGRTKGRKNAREKVVAKAPTPSLLAVLLKQKYVQLFEPLSGVSLHRWIRAEVATHEGTITPDAVEELVLRVGNNLWQMDQELQKLVAYAPAVTRAHVVEMVHGKFEETIFALTDAIGARSQTQALTLIERELARGANHLYLLSMIIRQFRILLMVRESLDQGATEKNIASTLSLHPFVARKAMAQAAAFSGDRLRALYAQLFAIERDFKTTRKDPVALLTSFVSSV